MKPFHASCHIVLLAFLLLVLPSARPALAQVETNFPDPPGTVAARLQERYDAMRSLSFSFVQSTEGQMAGRPREGSGRAVFLKTSGAKRMRWDYDSPERQVLVSDGTTFSMYFENLHQMIVSPAKVIEEDMTYSFFTGTGKLTDNFAILGPNKNIVDTEYRDLRVIQLVPRSSESQVQDIHLWIGADSLIRRLEIRDQFDTLTVLTLNHIEENSLDGKDEQALSALFTFSPPEDTEIIHQNE
ncbi:outer membrane lipoprotein carrier protein LolA [Desulfoprunum benzoelyticum]|uniref:Outer membrane lipoprotein carrier protein n=1 Tax=Desulfoprunum benzoelyticum TaxID=1506996 RepID=A0A840V1Q9_9BACT|nr:outer membrane lipoprotein carrier protein LolA [Desulfoprunum benzoelyticum]MBB5347649.1 outer membrane lipoprotein carrier protein [Desulfoprunum benzoelyticum]MBM9529223.1 outer membrane lipoprotein carrier protein LolA [Desulfoprunum benzoelyticum]